MNEFTPQLKDENCNDVNEKIATCLYSHAVEVVKSSSASMKDVEEVEFLSLEIINVNNSKWLLTTTIKRLTSAWLMVSNLQQLHKSNA